MTKARGLLESIFRKAIDACRADGLLGPWLPPPPRGRTLVLAVGKAAIDMARVVEAADRYGRLEGVVVAPHDAPGAAGLLPILRAGHPAPDAGSEAAAAALLELAAGAGGDDLVLVLLSGGASALAAAPGQGLSLADKQRVTQDLLRSGAPIAEINCVRRHLSAIKGGRLAVAAHPAKVVTLAVSDVVGDAPQDIGSGPTAADPTSLGEARAVLRRHGVADPGAGWSESIKPDDPRIAGADYRLVGSNADVLAAAAAAARGLGFTPEVLAELEGEARDVGAAHARDVIARLGLGKPFALISGGELTVTVRGHGRGGPSQEYALALMLGLAGAPGVHALAGDTDGVDGVGGAAGAFVTPDSLERARRLGLDPHARLAANDSGGLFEALGDLFVTGQTGVNANDLRIVLGPIS